MERPAPFKQAPRLKASITSKTAGEALRASLRRLEPSGGFDRSVPVSLRFEGLKLSPPTSTDVRVVYAGSLSPFILDLGKESTVLEAPASIPAPDFLRAFQTVSAARPLPNFLALSPEDLGEQLAEEAALYAPRRAFAPVFRRRAPKAAATLLPAFPAAKPLNVASLVPERPLSSPQSLSSQGGEGAFRPLAINLDLPEAEDGEEDESPMVRFEFNQMVVETEEEEVPTKTAWTLPAFPSFQFAWAGAMPRAIGAFVLLSCISVLPLQAMTVVSDLRDSKADAESASYAALDALKAGAGAVAAQDAGGARNSFDRAAERFGAARRAVDDLGGTVTFLVGALPSGGSARAGIELVGAGESLSRAGARLADGVIAAGKSSSASTDRLRLIDGYARSALPFLEDARERIERVDADDVPETVRPSFLSLKERVPAAADGLRQYLAVSEALVDILGGNGTRQYLAVFQNDTEMRPTGGFMGSFAELTVRDGEIVAMNVPGGGTYDMRGTFKDFLVAPDPLRLLSARWEFQDANWFPDFPTSARQIMQFYEASGGATVDGVVAVNSNYVSDLLSMLGEFHMPEYGRVITGANFVPEAQKIVELEYDKAENKPKEFIGDLAGEVLTRAKELSGNDFLTLLEHVNQGLERREIQLYFADDAAQKTVTDLGWDGGIRWTEGDYLMVVDTNLGGGKTDGVISQTVDMLVNVASDGTATNTVTVARTHHGSPDDLFSGANNVDYLRLYVPKGSQLLSASGFTPPPKELFEEPEEGWKIDDELIYAAQTEAQHRESGTAIHEEQGKTVFGNWVQTRPGATSTVTFTYRLPFKVAVPTVSKTTAFLNDLLDRPDIARYTLLVQKQSGVQDRVTRVRVETPDALQALWTSADQHAIQFTNERDGFFAGLYEQERP